MKKTQLIAVWGLPLIVIGGLFYPALGYLVLVMIFFFTTLSFFRGRYWCWNLCPRGAFLDIVLSRISCKRPVPRIFFKQHFRWLVFILLMAFLLFRVTRTGGDPVLIGGVFVGMCLLTTIVAIFLAIITKHRAWCMICPMGTLQETIGKVKKQRAKRNYRYIYGPVSSWRLGRSLGIDPISAKEKICTFDCIYCQVGLREPSGSERKIFVPTDAIITEVESLPSLKIDYITFSGKGEPTLANNLGEIIREIKKIRKEKIAIITNASLIDRKDVQEDLQLADFVMAKIDVCSKALLGKINRPAEDVEFDKIIKGINDFRAGYKGKFALQIMFVEENKESAADLAAIVEKIQPDEVQINTPLRPCGVKPLTKNELDAITGYFKGSNVISVYDVRMISTKSINKEDTLRRRGTYD